MQLMYVLTQSVLQLDLSLLLNIIVRSPHNDITAESILCMRFINFSSLSVPSARNLNARTVVRRRETDTYKSKRGRVWIYMIPVGYI